MGSEMCIRDRTEGKVLVTPGWLAVYGKEAQGDEETPNLPPLEKNERIWAKDVEVKGKATQPPPRFTEATLLTAMEGAGKLIDDEELREAMSERGLGTPATRAATIEGLLAEEYLHRNGRELQPTAKAFSLLFALTQLQVDEIRSPELTGEWEYKLKEMEQGRLSRDEFMNHIVEQTQVMVERIKTGEFADPDFGTLKTPCPRCGAALRRVDGSRARGSGARRAVGPGNVRPAAGAQAISRERVPARRAARRPRARRPQSRDWCGVVPAPPAGPPLRPQRGHPSLPIFSPSIHIAGQVPLPAGSLALTSILPYLKEALFFVCNLAEVYCLFSFTWRLAVIFNTPSTTIAFKVSLAV